MLDKLGELTRFKARPETQSTGSNHRRRASTYLEISTAFLLATSALLSPRAISPAYGDTLDKDTFTHSITVQRGQQPLYFQTDSGSAVDLTPPDSSQLLAQDSTPGDMVSGSTETVQVAQGQQTETQTDVAQANPLGNTDVATVQTDSLLKQKPFLQYGNLKTDGFELDEYLPDGKNPVPVLMPYGTTPTDVENKFNGFKLLYSPIWQEPGNASNQIIIEPQNQFNIDTDGIKSGSFYVGPSANDYITLFVTSDPKDPKFKLGSSPAHDAIAKTYMTFGNDDVCNPALRAKIDKNAVNNITRNIPSILTGGFVHSWSDGMKGVEKIGQLYDYFKLACIDRNNPNNISWLY